MEGNNKGSELKAIPFLSACYVLLYGVTKLHLLWALYDSVALCVYVETVMKPCNKAEMGQTQAIIFKRLLFSLAMVNHF